MILRKLIFVFLLDVIRLALLFDNLVKTTLSLLPYRFWNAELVTGLACQELQKTISLSKDQRYRHLKSFRTNEYNMFYPDINLRMELHLACMVRKHNYQSIHFQYYNSAHLIWIKIRKTYIWSSSLIPVF
jgi:hypothetical protein